MSDAGLISAAAAVVVAAFALAGAVYTGRAPTRASPYAVVIERVVTLEEQRKEDTARIEALQTKVSTLERGRADDQTEIAGLQRRVVGVIEDRDDLVRYISILRAWIASGARPPAPAVPVHLADVLPEWVPGDGAEPPLRRNDDTPGP